MNFRINSYYFSINTTNQFVLIMETHRDFSAKFELWHIDPLLGKDLETDETTAVVMQRRGKHTSTTTVPVGNGVFMWFVPRSYLEDNWGDPVSS
jgi:hypothetical protein